VQEALRRGVAVWSEVEFAMRFLSNRVIGITGTNGKTTTTELTGAIFREAGSRAAVGGNVGHALAGMPDVVPPEATVVAELSSFQLEHIDRFRPDVAVLLNLTEDHLDRHGDYRGYVDAKLHIFENQVEDDVALLNADDPGTLAEAAAGRLGGHGRRAWFSAEPGRDVGPGGGWLAAGVDAERQLWLDLDGERVALCMAGELALKGDHNRQDSLAAAAAACALGVPPAAAARALCSFAGVPHRLQVAGVVGGVTYVNDSKATNIDATLKALTAYSSGVYLILGGYDKGAEYGALAAATEGLVKLALLIGATAPRLEAAFAARAAAAGSRATPHVACGDLEAAVKHAAGEASPGDVVLLSPACASFDQYRDYEERGEHFHKLVSDLRGAGTS
jgi:UDP-N-acetylmuramoylalanine--D-glutamate ligase